MKVQELINILLEMPKEAVVGIENMYLFPADIQKVEYKEIEGEPHVIITEE